jgi:hypothetical protein
MGCRCLQVNDLKNSVLWLTNMNHAKGDMPRELPAGVLDPKVNSAAGYGGCMLLGRTCFALWTLQQQQRRVQFLGGLSSAAS